jgi:transcriptional repressor NF-X1
VDAENRQDDHVPYQGETLNMYLEQPAWAQAQEKELRAFAIDPDLKRKRFEPMKPRQRAFMHSLAEDFGFDTESMDPEPHRHVAVFKTPKFVMAPMKTLAECARIRQIQRAMTQQTANEALKSKVVAPVAKTTNLVGDPFNAFLISHARFGLTVEDVRAAIAPVVPTNLHMEVSFLPTEDVVLRPGLETSFASPQALEAQLSTLKDGLYRALAGPPFLGRIQLCRVDSSLNMLRRESDVSTGGWSQVAKAAAAPRRAPQHTGVEIRRNGFAVLETAAAKAKKEKKIQRAPTVDDWEEAMLQEEEAEKLVSAGNSGDEGAAGSGTEDMPETEVIA